MSNEHPCPRRRSNIVDFNISNYDFIVFDCDGVILDSNAAKSRAFYETTQRFGEALATRFVVWHQAHGGITRHEKFRYFIETMLGKPLSENAPLLTELLNDYAKRCQQALSHCPFVPGVIAFIEKKPAGMPAYVVTGGAQDEVRALFKQRGIAHHFSAILGSPTSKHDNLLSLHGRGDLKGKGVLFGDAQLDCELAKTFALDFIFVAAFSEWGEGEFLCPHTISDFTDL